MSEMVALRLVYVELTADYVNRIFILMKYS